MVAVVEIELTDYRVPVMLRLQERLGEPVVVYHGIPAPGSSLNVVEPGRDVGFSHRRFPQRWLFDGRLLVSNPLSILRRPRPRAVIVRHTVRNPTLPILVISFRVLGIPVIGWGHGYSQRRTFRPSRRITDLAHLAVVKSCDAYVCYSAENRAVLSKYVSPDRLFVAQNTVDVESLFELRQKLGEQGRVNVRRELGLDPDLPYLCFIGRLQHRKRPEVLLEALAVLQADGMRVGLVLVGEGPMRETLVRRAKELELSDVVFTGARYGEEAARYLYASNLMAMPGALGLAAAHSMALGVPVVTQRLGVGLVGHGPEAAYVKDGVNGRMAERGGATAFASALREALSRRQELSSGAIEFARANLHLDHMVDGFVHAIAYATE